MEPGCIKMSKNVSKIIVEKRFLLILSGILRKTPNFFDIYGHFEVY